MKQNGTIKTMFDTRDVLQRELAADPRFNELRDLTTALAVFERYHAGGGFQTPAIKETHARKTHDGALRKMAALGMRLPKPLPAPAGRGKTRGAKHAKESVWGAQQRAAAKAGKRPIDWLQTVLNGTPIPKDALATRLKQATTVIYNRDTVPASRVIGLALTALRKQKLAKEVEGGWIAGAKGTAGGGAAG